MLATHDATDAPFLSLEDAGRLLGVKRARAWELARAGILPSVCLGRRWYIPRCALDALVDDAIERAKQGMFGE